MFLFSRKTKTPISTYSDSFRAPTSIKEVYKDPPLWAWEANKFLTRGLTNAMQHHVDPNAVQMDKCATQDYPYKSSLSGHPYFPEKYWFSQEEEDKYCPSYLGGYRYNSWKMGPYNNPYWSKYSSYLPRLSNKDTGVDAVVRGMPLEYPPKPERLNAYGLYHPSGTDPECNVLLHLPCHHTTHFQTLDGTQVTSRRPAGPRETVMLFTLSLCPRTILATVVGKAWAAQAINSSPQRLPP
ncbi:spermatid-specific manchette-related protein 1 isoform X2 [Perognathus longimembris pacificus]|uniref:spermatid-specific manchette-related protein 1 isoform X2 n=1 Tax=Perognathus longimembris pacificus TaxID=214514 RepID=UPI0020189424|nr:spermatid-specific manchette-related protein 1 isoform X2 [Perognathus longimembris pacificus]